MLQKSIKLLLLCFLLTACSLKSNDGANSQRISYSDRENPHAKMQLPLEMSWVHDKAGNPKQPINVTITARAMSDLTNVKISLTLSPDLKLVSGETTKSIATLAAGTSIDINLTVSPEKTGSYDINILLNASLNGENIGSGRTLRFETSDYVAQKSQAHPSGLHIIEGRTDNKK